MAEPLIAARAKECLRTQLPGLVSVPAQAKADGPEWPQWLAPPPGEQRIGICCSGGGIRSASYGLGALQALEEAGVLQRAEDLATVSGGGYIGGALTMVAASPNAELVWGEGRPAPFARMSPEERYLRDHSTYLAPDIKGRLRLVSRLLLGMIVNLCFVTALAILAGRLLGWFAGEVLPDPLRPGVHTGNWHVKAWMFGTGVVAGLGLLLLLVTATVLMPPSRNARIFRVGLVVMGAAVIVFAAVVAIPAVIMGVRNAAAGLAFAVDWIFRHVTPAANATPSTRGDGGALVTKIGGVLTALGLPTMLLGVLRAGLKKDRSKLALLAGGVVAPLLLAYALFASGSDAASRGWGTRQWAWLLPAAAVASLIWLFGDLTTGSMYPFYKKRLASAFALQRCWRRPDGTLVESAEATGELAAGMRDYDALVSLSRTVPPKPWPKLVCCAAANVSDPGITPPGRNAVSFTFDADWVGGPDIGYVQTSAFESALGSRRAADITMMAAMAISAAAVSPSMGRMSRPSVRFLLALTNARLGVWLPHPHRVSARLAENDRLIQQNHRPKKWLSRPRFTYLWREMTGNNTTRAPFLYVTDGGHWENLGLVEVRRRRCTTVYCVDASGDDEHTFTTIGAAIALARSDLGVDIDLDPSVMGKTDADDPSYCAADYAIGTITWPATRDTPELTGRLVFIKATVTRNAPWDVRAYKLRFPDFPNDTTAQQLYGDEKFESYRALGHDSMCRAHKALANLPTKTVDLASARPPAQRREPRHEPRRPRVQLGEVPLLGDVPLP
jgi:hypothetical protein